MATLHKMTGIGAKEADLIATVGTSGLRVFTVAEAAKLLGIANTAVSKLIHRLVHKHKLQRIEKGKYLLIPPEAWKAGNYTEEGIIIASQLIKPYYLSYWTALQFYGWTEQQSKTIYVASLKVKRPVAMQGMTIQFVKKNPDRFFGFAEHWVGNQKITVADKEKAIVDCLDDPRYAGELVEIAKGLWNGRKELDYFKLVEYGTRMKSGAILKRLGFIMDALGTMTPKFKRELQKHMTPSLVPLAPTTKRVSGSVDPNWHVRVNINPKSLTDWRLT